VNRTWALALGLLAIALIARLPDLGAACNADGVLYWFGRTQKFWAALADGRLAETYYSPHPGVSLMWLSGASMKLFGTLGTVNETAVVAATLPVALLGSAVPPLTYLLLRRALPVADSYVSYFSVPLLTGFLIATEPFLVAHSRTYHMDSLVTGFVWIGLLLGTLTVLERRPLFAVLAGLCLGLAMLTRMVSGVFALSLACVFAAAFAFERPRTRTLPLLLGMAAGTALVVVYFGWPAMMVDPGKTLKRIIRQSSRLVEKGHAAFAWGKVYTTDPGLAFYAGAFLVRLTPELLGGVLALPFLARGLPRRALIVLAALGASYLPFTLAVLFGAKKGDRYLLFLFPLLALLASVALVEIARRVRTSGILQPRTTTAIAAALGVIIAVRVVRLALVHPLPITWCAPYPGLRCENVITIGHGEGFRDVARWISEHSRLEKPTVLSAYGRGAMLRPWLNFVRAESGKDAHFVVTYIASDQRRRDLDILPFAVGDPLHEVRYQGRVYARIYRGPRYHQAKR